jgi:hypothetical protein
LMSFVMTPPTVSMPKAKGVTSSSNKSCPPSPLEMPACTAHPLLQGLLGCCCSCCGCCWHRLQRLQRGTNVSLFSLCLLPLRLLQRLQKGHKCQSFLLLLVATGAPQVACKAPVLAVVHERGKCTRTSQSSTAKPTQADTSLVARGGCLLVALFKPSLSMSATERDMLSMSVTERRAARPPR